MFRSHKTKVDNRYEMIRERKRDDLGASRDIMVSKFAFEAILMHNPVALFSFRSSSSVKHQSLLHTHKRACLGAVNLSIFPSSFPVPSFGCSVSSKPSLVFPITETEKIPLFLTHLRFLCQMSKKVKRLKKLKEEKNGGFGVWLGGFFLVLTR